MLHFSHGSVHSGVGDGCRLCGQSYAITQNDSKHSGLLKGQRLAPFPSSLSPSTVRLRTLQRRGSRKVSDGQPRFNAVQVQSKGTTVHSRQIKHKQCISPGRFLHQTLRRSLGQSAFFRASKIDSAMTTSLDPGRAVPPNPCLKPRNTVNFLLAGYTRIALPVGPDPSTGTNHNLHNLVLIST